MSDKKQTAVQWLSEHLVNEINFDYWSAIEKALEMEKEQIIEACENTIKSFELDKDKTGFFAMGGEGYYNETFKNTENEKI